MGLFITQSYNEDKTLVYPHFKYHIKNHNPTKIFCHTPCSIKHWNIQLKRVERGDKEYKLKNLKIQSLQTKLDGIINRFKINDELLTPQRLKLELEKREYAKEAHSYSSLPLLNLVQDWEKEYMDDNDILEATKIRTKSIIKHIKDYIVEVQTENSSTLLIDNLDKTFLKNFANHLFIIPTINGVGLFPSSVKRRFTYLQTFCKWYSDNSKEYKRIKIPKAVTKATRIVENEDPIYFHINELIKLVNFTEFNFLEPKNIKNGEIEWVESKKWEKHLTRDRQNREKKNGVLEFFYEETKYGKQIYTSWEVYKDFFVFLCSVGCRYSDGVKMKVGDFEHAKRDKNSHIKDGVVGVFKFYQKKTNTVATPRGNEVSFEIYKKYSRGKITGDNLFPRTKRGNQISDVKFNKQLKKICKTIGFNRKIVQRKLGNKGVEINSEKKHLWEIVSSKIGRKTYIKTMVSAENFTIQQMMKMSGHLTDKVFNQYYSIEDKDILSKLIKPFLENSGSSKIDSKTVSHKLTPPQLKELTQNKKLEKLLNDKNLGNISNEFYEKMYEKLMMM